ncbi:MAG TPA: hypothetical protein PKX31_00250 [Chitinophagaceae bacterium]|nr:hypothetical protein [Chitinophagaceae bacterium]
MFGQSTGLFGMQLNNIGWTNGASLDDRYYPVGKNLKDFSEEDYLRTIAHAISWLEEVETT